MDRAVLCLQPQVWGIIAILTSCASCVLKHPLSHVNSATEPGCSVTAAEFPVRPALAAECPALMPLRCHRHTVWVSDRISFPLQVLIPVFALGRAQELCILLETFW